ncbi:MAG: hypothetical protein ACD_39C00453G0002, partial [uncultured bacterium]
MPGKGSERQFRLLTPETPATSYLLLFWLLAVVLPMFTILVLVRHSELNQTEQLKTDLSDRMLDSMTELQRQCNAVAYFKSSIINAEVSAGLPPRHSNLVANDAMPEITTYQLQQKFAAIKGFKLVMLITGRNDFSDIQIFHDSKNFADYPRPGQWAARTLLKAIAARIRGRSTDQELSAVELRMLRNFNDSIFGTYFSPIDKDEDFSYGFNVRNGGTNLHTARRIVQDSDKSAALTYLAIFAETSEAFNQACKLTRSMATEFAMTIVLKRASLHQFIVENPDTSLSLYAPVSYTALNADPHRAGNLIDQLIRQNADRKSPFRYPHLVISSQPLTRLVSKNYFYARFGIFLLICLSLLAIKHFQQNSMRSIKIRGRLFAAVFLATLLPATAFLFMAYHHNRQQTQLRQNNLIKEMKTRLKLFELNLRSQDENLGMKATDLASDLRKHMASSDDEVSKILKQHVTGAFDSAMMIRSNGMSLEIIDPKSIVLRNNPEQLSFSRDIFFAAIIKFFSYLKVTSDEFFARLESTPHGRKLKALSSIFTREDVENFCSYEGTAQTSKKSSATLRFINFKILPGSYEKGMQAAVLLLVQDIRKVIEKILTGSAHDWSFYHQPGKEGLIKTMLIGTYDLDASSIDPESIWPAATSINSSQQKLIDAIAQGKGEVSRIITSGAAPPVVMVARR